MKTILPISLLVKEALFKVSFIASSDSFTFESIRSEERRVGKEC